MFAGQHELGFGVIEFLDESRAFPGAGVMTTLAGLLELTLMDIFVAGGTAVETQANILRSSIGLRKMAALAFHLDVSARERVTRLGVIEALVRSFPILIVMTLGAVGTQTSLMLVLVAAGTRLREAEIGVTEVLHSDRRAFRRRDVLQGVAALAGKVGVLSVENEPCFRVVELLWIPFHQCEILAVVFRVTMHARGRSRLACHEFGMISALLLQTIGDFPMTIKATKARRSRGNFMALHAPSRPRKFLVNLRQRAGRNLCFRHQGQQEQNGEQSKEPHQWYGQRGTLRRIGAGGQSVTLYSRVRLAIRKIGISQGCRHFTVRVNCLKQSKFHGEVPRRRDSMQRRAPKTGADAWVGRLDPQLCPIRTQLFYSGSPPFVPGRGVELVPRCSDSRWRDRENDPSLSTSPASNVRRGSSGNLLTPTWVVYPG